MGDDSPERRSGCGLLTAVFGGRHLWPRKSSPGSFQTSKSLGNDLDDEFLDPSNPEKKSKTADRIIQPPNSQQGNVQARKVPQAGLGLSGELDSLIMDNHRLKGAGNLVRASSGKVMLYGSLGNLKQPGNTGAEKSTDVLDLLPKSAKEDPMPIDVGYSARNAAKKTDGSEKPVPLCRALSTRMDPEELKILGNEDYKNGKFAEALALYEAAISIDPNKASYRSNKSAALTCLGRLLEAAFECREAIRIDPLYQRAHNRLATLSVR